MGIEGGPGYSYDESHNVLFITPFSHADFDTQKLFAKAAREQRAGASYDELLFTFFAAHQMMHLVYDRLPLAPTNQYEEEQRINTMTWLFLKEYDLMPVNEMEQLELLNALEATLVRLQKSRRVADAMGSQRNYVGSLSGRVAEAEASN